MGNHRDLKGNGGIHNNFILLSFPSDFMCLIFPAGCGRQNILAGGSDQTLHRRRRQQFEWASVKPAWVIKHRNKSPCRPLSSQRVLIHMQPPSSSHHLSHFDCAALSHTSYKVDLCFHCHHICYLALSPPAACTRLRRFNYQLYKKKKKQSPTSGKKLSLIKVCLVICPSEDLRW